MLVFLEKSWREVRALSIDTKPHPDNVNNKEM